MSGHWEQLERKRLRKALADALRQVRRLRAERRKLKPHTLEWTWVDEALFEARCKARTLRTALRMAGTRWLCLDCGETYGPEWVAYYGPRCHTDCDGWLQSYTPRGYTPAETLQGGSGNESN